MAEKDGMVKIRITLPESDWHKFAAETAWATPLGDDLYRIENSLFFADGISYHDIVFARKEDGIEIPLVKGVTKRSGNSTYRILLSDMAGYEKFCAYIAPLTAIGCTYQGLKGHQFSLNVPSSVPVLQVHPVLQKGDEEGIWFFESSHIYMMD